MLLKLIQKSLLPQRKPRSNAFWLVACLMCINATAATAQEKPKPDVPLVNPLEIIKPDPLLPQLPKKPHLAQSNVPV